MRLLLIAIRWVYRPEVLKGPLDAIEGRLAIDDPLLTIELASESLKVPGVLEMADMIGEYQSIRLEASFEKVKEPSFEQRRHHPDRDKKPLRHETQRPPSEDSPPPVTIQWMWG